MGAALMSTRLMGRGMPEQDGARSLLRARPDTWFDAGSLVTLGTDYRPQLNAGLFSGLRGGKLDEEVCLFAEFLDSVE